MKTCQNLNNVLVGDCVVVQDEYGREFLRRVEAVAGKSFLAAGRMFDVVNAEEAFACDGSNYRAFAADDQDSWELYQ